MSTTQATATRTFPKRWQWIAMTVAAAVAILATALVLAVVHGTANTHPQAGVRGTGVSTTIKPPYTRAEKEEGLVP
jgi:hypothetical protein